MAKRIVSFRKAQIFSFVLFLIGLVILVYYGQWWPGIALVIGLPLALREYLMGRTYDMLVTLFVFLGVYVTVQFDIVWRVFLPVLFTVGGIYIFFREFFGGTRVTEDESEEDLNNEINEKKKDHNSSS